jgi:hypothetical protein
VAKRRGLWEVKGFIQKTKGGAWNKTPSTAMLVTAEDFAVASSQARDTLMQRYGASDVKIQSVIYECPAMVA